MNNCYKQGWSRDVFGPSWIDLKNTINLSMDEMQYGLAARQTTYVVGALVSGVLYKRLNRQLLLSLFYLALGATMTVFPYLRSLLLYILVQLAFGFFQGVCDPGTNAWVIELWLNKPAPFLAALHTAYAVGTIISPITTRPFLTPDNSSEPDTTFTTV